MSEFVNDIVVPLAGILILASIALSTISASIAFAWIMLKIALRKK
jgi:hypothetical protein